MKIGDCPKCVRYYYEEGSLLIEACATVAIENGKTTTRMLVEYLSAYHHNGHRPFVRENFVDR